MNMTNLTPGMSTARRSMTAEAFQESAFALGRQRIAIRETLQAMTSEQILGVLERLASRQDPSPDDLEIVRMWIVGDADSYLRQENNFDDWVAEYERLEDVIAGYEGRACTESELLELKGILEDAVRVAHDIANYLEKKERVEQFESAVHAGTNWDRDRRETLLQILRGKLQSANV
ncbi:MAG: hypothetical protein P8188_15955 [Gemmatimonadota bacterium]